MRRIHRLILLLQLVLLQTVVQAATTDACPPANGVALQVLGSGGPIADDARASAGYLVWVDGVSKILIDAGGGTFLRFGEAGASFNALDFIGLSHFHTDHSADLPALLKSGYFANRERSLSIAGPDAGGPFPGLNSYLGSMFNDESGAYGYLSGYLDGTAGLPRIESIEVSPDSAGRVTIFGGAKGELQIQAMHVPHGIVPALAFRVRAGQSSIVFASDQNGNDERFIEFANSADVLIMHMPVPEGVSGAGRKLHAPPSVIGAIAARAQVGTLVLSHLMGRSLQDLDANVGIVKSLYGGAIVVANDLDCVAIQE